MHRLRLVVPVLLALGAGMAPQIAGAQVTIGVAVTVPPPVLPVYEQPPLPGPGYVWVPGYWAWGPDGYYWVPGTWVLPPAEGLLWTPAYWAWSNGAYVFVPGYWGPQVGYYGGIDYGYGYFGVGYSGGYWRNGAFFYNRAVNNFGRERIEHFYDRPVASRQAFGRASFNGGRGGAILRPTPQQEAFAHQSHPGLTPLQMQHQQAAAGNHALWNSQNHGRPPIAATSRPGMFNTGAVPATPMHPAPGPVTPPHPTGPSPRPLPHVVEPNSQYHPAPASQPQYHPVSPQPQYHPAPAQQPQYHPAPAQQPQYHPAPAQQPQYHPAPAQQPQYHPAPAQQPQYHPAPAQQPQYHPAPAQQPQYHPAPAQQPQYHPAPAQQPQYHPAPAQQPQYHPAPAQQPQYHPAPQAAPQHAPQQQQHDDRRPPGN